MAKTSGRSVTSMLAVGCACGATALMAPPTLAAGVTESHVSTPVDGSLLFQSRVSEPTAKFAVAGTSNGTSGDSVDIDCYQAGSRVGGYTTGVAVAANGSFSAQVPEASMPTNTCHLVAVPHGTTPSLGSAYTGPRVALSSFSVSTITNGPNAGDAYSLSLGDMTMSAQQFISSIDECGPAATLPDGSEAVGVSGYIFNCAGSFYDAPQEFFDAKELDLKRSEIQVDGQNGYGSGSAHGLFAASEAEKKEGKKSSDELAGFPVLSATLDSFNLATAEAQTTEREPLVRCTPEDIYAATPASCREFASTGIAVVRSTRFTHSGRVATVTDTYASTDGAQHALDLLYETDLEGSAPGWQLPGEASLRQRNTGETGAARPAPATVYTINNAAQTPSFTDLVGAMTFGTPYNSVRFDNSLWFEELHEESALFDYQRAVPAGGCASITWSYATGTSVGEVGAEAAESQAQITREAQPAAISIAAPTGGESVHTATVAVSGSASASSCVASVSVNGVNASLVGSSYSATVPLTPGSNTITANVTSDDGNTATAQVKVTYTPASLAAPTPPRLGSAHESARKWREGAALARISRAHNHTLPVGTTFSFTLNEAASVRFEFMQTASGRKVGRRCTAPTRYNHHNRRCPRPLFAGVLRFAGHPGANSVHFDGRISRAERLRAGVYTLVIAATNSAGQSSTPQKLRFTVVG